MSYELGQGTGPLRGVKVVEIAGIGPGPHACMILADLGADVIRLERPGGAGTAGGDRRTDLLTRGRPSVALDLKNPAAVQAALQLIESADVLIEGMRPGATERLGLGPDECLARNPRLVYGRMTGWGQTGPWAHAAGHDMNYIAITGALHGLGQDPARPHFPSNLVGDFGGGSTYLVIGVLAALLEARAVRTGPGRRRRDRGRYDAPQRDGDRDAGRGLVPGAAGQQPARRGRAVLRPLRDRRRQAHERRRARAAVLRGVRDAARGEGHGARPLRPGPVRRAEAGCIADTFLTRTQAEWAKVFDGTDACVAPVLPTTEAAGHPHLAAREVLVRRDDVLQPAPAPRFSRTEATLSTPPSLAGGDTRAALEAWGVTDVDALVESGAAVQA